MKKWWWTRTEFKTLMMQTVRHNLMETLKAWYITTTQRRQRGREGSGERGGQVSEGLGRGKYSGHRMRQDGKKIREGKV